MANELLKSVYYDLKNPAGYASLKKLVNATGLKEQVVRTWLKQQPTFTLHQQARKVYPTRRYVVHDIDEQWQADLAEMGLIARHNDGHRYILTVIDLFSRYAWARPLKTKRGEDVANAFSSIFEEGRIPRRIQTDQGKEFENRHVRSLFQEYNVELFSVKSAYKHDSSLMTRKQVVPWLSVEQTFAPRMTQLCAHRFRNTLSVIARLCL